MEVRMLSDSDVIANVAVKDLAVSKKFYSGTLGLKLVDDSDFGLTYKSGSGRLFVYVTPMAGTAKSTCASWEVKDIKKATDELAGKVKFEHYDFPGAKHDGHVHIMGGMKAAWFRDPSGNILGLSEAQ
jgi:catechol 2,3-dioxygenase-like lactoylglutathione lyase family enzyme